MADKKNAVRLPEPTAAEVEFAQQLVERAKADGVSLVGPGGLAGISRTVLESALDAELDAQLDEVGVDEATGRRTNIRHGHGAKTELDPVGRTPEVWGQRPWCGGVYSASWSTGRRIPMLEWRLIGLYQHTIHSNIALARSVRVFHGCLSRTSSCRVLQNDSITEFVGTVADCSHRAEQVRGSKALSECP